MYLFVKEYYDMGLFNDDDLQMYVTIGWITKAEMKQIKG